MTVRVEPRAALRPAQPMSTEDRVGFDLQWRTLEALYREEATGLARYFARRVPANDVWDLVHESFRRIIGHSAERPVAFVMRTASHLVSEHWRTARRRGDADHVPLDEAHDGGEDPFACLVARDSLARIDTALNALSPKTRNIFLLSRIEGKSYAEIAEAYGMSVMGVKKQVAKAMLLLRRRVGPL